MTVEDRSVGQKPTLVLVSFVYFASAEEFPHLAGGYAEPQFLASISKVIDVLLILLPDSVGKG